MEFGKITGAVLVGVMMIVIVMVVVIPVIDDATYDKIGKNTPDYYYGPVPEGTITWSSNGYSIDGATPVKTGSGVLIISDSMVVMTTASSMRLYDYGGENYGQISSIVITGNSYTTTGTTVASGSLGNNAHFNLPSAEGATHGQFYDTSFYIDKNNAVQSFRAGVTMTDGSDGTADARVLVFGKINDLDALAVNLVDSTYTEWTSFDAEIYESSVTEPNSVVYSVAGEPNLSLSGTLDGTDYTGSLGSGARFVAPLDYTEITDTGNAIRDMIGIVPLLMIVGVIIMIIGMIVMRS